MKALADQSFARAGAQDGRIIGLARKNLAHPLREMLNWQGLIVRIKAVLVPPFAEGCTVFKVDMAALSLALVTIAAHMVAIVEHLEITVFLDHPGALLSHKGPKDRGGIFVVIVGRKNIADIMQQR